MLFSTPREGAGRRFATGARVFCLLLSLAASLAAAALGGAPLPGSPAAPAGKKVSPTAAAGQVAAATVTDLTAELQRLADATDQIEPSSPDAVARLKSIVRELIEVVKADRREVVALRAGANSRASTATARRSRKKAAAPRTSSTPAAPAALAGEFQGSDSAGEIAAGAGAFFGKRGLKKFHRPGCAFGERIHAEDRVYFKTVEEATAAGYEACKICKPGG